MLHRFIPARFNLLRSTAGSVFAVVPANRAPTVSEAIDYAHKLLGNLPGGIIVAGSLINAQDSDLRDVLFDYDGHRYRLTCWMETTLDGAPSVYGEW